MSVYYEVRFTCYQYNGGGQIKNGPVACRERFLELDMAMAVQKFIISNFGTEELHNWVYDHHYVWDGYLSKYDGIYKIEETKIS